jgi:AraC-like DNA-binding protein
MALTIPSRSELLKSLQTQILPRVEDGSAALVLASPPLTAPPGIRVTPQQTALLRSKQRRASGIPTHWIEEGFNAIRYPTLIWVAAGEADMRIGVTQRMATRNKALSKKHGSYIVSLPVGSFLIIPPGIPFSDASRPHWERPMTPEVHSHLLWFRIEPAGASLHSCTTHSERHASTRSLFIGEARLLHLCEVLIEELLQRENDGEAAARHYLAVMMLYLARHIRNLRMPIDEAAVTTPDEQYAQQGNTPVQRACRYVDTHLSHKLTLELIAAYSYVSPTHLNRLFRAQMKMSVGEYLTQRRLLHARSLLENSDLPIQRVAAFSGFATPEHFNRTFRRHTGISPGDYRRAGKS